MAIIKITIQYKVLKFAPKSDGLPVMCTAQDHN